MTYRYALVNKSKKVHRTLGDDTLMTVCGVLGASLVQRFSRRTAKALRGLDDCKLCARILGSRR